MTDCRHAIARTIPSLSVRLTANLFVVMTSLVLGLMINSAKNTFESIDHNVHAYATELILFDRSLRQYGPETQDARQSLIAYVQRVVDATSVSQKTPAVANKLSELLLNEIGNRLAQLAPPTIMLIRPDGYYGTDRRHWRIRGR
jgi:hypothetical protein